MSIIVKELVRHVAQNRRVMPFAPASAPQTAFAHLAIKPTGFVFDRASKLPRRFLKRTVFVSLIHDLGGQRPLDSLAHEFVDGAMSPVHPPDAVADCCLRICPVIDKIHRAQPLDDLFDNAWCIAFAKQTRSQRPGWARRSVQQRQRRLPACIETLRIIRPALPSRLRPRRGVVGVSRVSA